MRIPLAFIRLFFFLLSIFLMVAFMTTLPSMSTAQKVLTGIGLGVMFSCLLLGVEVLFHRYNLRAFTTVAIGLFFGYLMGQALVVITHAVFIIGHLDMLMQPQTFSLIKIFIFLAGTYLGCLLTLHFSEEVSVSIPFIKLSQNAPKKKNLLLDESVLSDPRVLDFASTGLVDQMLFIPRFIIKQVYSQIESEDETTKARAKRSLDTLKKLQAMPELSLNIDEAQAHAEKDPISQLVYLARLNDCNLLTADPAHVQRPPIEGIKIINLHALSNALKPLMQAGEALKIKIQRFGKEPNQGVGYLEDGTMVVVNGGGDYISECIDVQVLSVKHTSSGRMIFCNTMDEIPAKGNRVEV